jgi:nitrogen regulation protein NR(I)
MYKILIVDDESSVRYSFRKLLGASEYKLFEAANYDEALSALQTHKPDLVLADIEMPGKSGLDLLKSIKELNPSIPVIVATAYGTSDRVIKAMKFGAYEYIEKPFDIPKLIALIEEALKTLQVMEKVETGIEKEKPDRRKILEEEPKIIGESPAIKEVYKLIGRVAASDASILVTGESGTGKELVARAIHQYSERASKPFVALNCAAIPESLLESELFGFDKGAFTGAAKDKAGKFEDANGGTLFLDEIGDMDLALQAKLLRVLQEGRFERLGSSKTIQVDVRIITATNKNLESLIGKKLFREDLFYRIRVVSIALPPLRMRKEDIPILARHFLSRYAYETRTDNIGIHPQALEKMLEYSWPGNIRELENTMKRCMILAKGKVITAELISNEFTSVNIPGQSQECGLDYYLTQSIIQKEGEILQLTTEALERDLIKWALEQTGGNQARAARMLGVSRVFMHERMEKFGIFKR